MNGATVNSWFTLHNTSLGVQLVKMMGFDRVQCHPKRVSGVASDSCAVASDGSKVSKDDYDYKLVR